MREAKNLKQEWLRANEKLLQLDHMTALCPRFFEVAHLGIKIPLAGRPLFEPAMLHPPARHVASTGDDDDTGSTLRRRPRASAAGFSAVREIDVRASAGPGAFNDGIEEAKATWLFPDPVIRHEFRAQAQDLYMVTIDGDSMEPLLASGDRILIDTSQRIPVPPGIFVIWDGMGIVAKRVEHVPHSDPTKIVIKSINPEYQTYEREAEEVNIVGRVIWAAKRL